MFNTIKTHVVVPLLGRLGTATSAWLIVTYGVSATQANQLGIGVTAAGLIIADLLIGYFNRKA